MNESFSAATRRLAAAADIATEKVIEENRSQWDSVPAQYRVAMRHLMRMAYYSGRGDGAQYIADSFADNGRSRGTE